MELFGMDFTLGEIIGIISGSIGFIVLVFLVVFYSVINTRLKRAFTTMGTKVRETNDNLLLLISLDMEIAKAVVPGKEAVQESKSRESAKPASTAALGNKKKASPNKARFPKGSKEAKERMAAIRAAKKTKEAVTV